MTKTLEELIEENTILRNRLSKFEELAKKALETEEYENRSLASKRAYREVNAIGSLINIAKEMRMEDI